MKRRFVTGFILQTASVFILATPVLAQESGGGGEKPGMFIWQTLNFLILASLLGWLAVKQGGPILAARGKGIQEGLAAGERAKAEADARAAEVQKKLDNLEKEIGALRTSAREEREREADRIRREAKAEIARIHAQAEQEIESAGKLARIEVQRAAARLAIEIAEQKVRERMTPALQAALLQGFLSDISKGALEPAPNAD
jgi:F-type H+-transporting ATPase subunit b